jgi:hypothetical protein
MTSLIDGVPTLVKYVYPVDELHKTAPMVNFLNGNTANWIIVSTGQYINQILNGVIYETNNYLKIIGFDSASFPSDGIITTHVNTTSIDGGAFNNCSELISITMTSVIDIGGSAFSSCSNLTSITIPDSVLSIGNRAFSDCTNLSGNIVLPSGLTTLDREAFVGCTSITQVNIPSAITHLNYTFISCSSLTTVTIDNNSTIDTISNAFTYCSSLTSFPFMDLPLVTINGSAFDGTGLTGIVEFPSTLQSISNGAFSNCPNITEARMTSLIDGVQTLMKYVYPVDELHKTAPMVNFLNGNTANWIIVSTGQYIEIDEIINARYIKLTNNDPTYGYVIIPELEVYNFNDENVALNKATSASSTQIWEGHANLPEYMVDGNVNQVWGTGSGPGGVFAHTNKWVSGDPEYIQVDLGSTINIKKIKVFQRTDWKGFITENFKLEILDEDLNVLKIQSLNYSNIIEYIYNQQSEPEPDPIVQCLNQSENNIVSMINPYLFNNIPYNNADYIGVNNGTYTLTGVTSSHPIGFVINNDSLFEVISGTLFGTKTVNSINVNYYTGNIEFEVKGDFGIISYHCYNHGYMGGENRLKYSDSCPIKEPEPEPEPEPQNTGNVISPLNRYTTFMNNELLSFEEYTPQTQHSKLFGINNANVLNIYYNGVLIDKKINKGSKSELLYTSNNNEWVKLI